jgi:hypothetical protein
MASFLDVPTQDAEEPKVVPGDQEYKIRIVGYRTKLNEETGEEEYVHEDKNENNYFSPYYDIPAEPMAKGFSGYVPIPGDQMDEKARMNAEWALEEFKQVFGIAQKFNFDDTIGNEGWAILKVDESEEYGEQNKIKRLIVPK